MSTAGCSGCTRRWTSPKEAHCQACHEQFGTHSLADQHHGLPFTQAQFCKEPSVVLSKKGARVFRASDEPEGVVWRTFARNTHVWDKA